MPAKDAAGLAAAMRELLDTPGRAVNRSILEAMGLVGQGGHAAPARRYQSGQLVGYAVGTADIAARDASDFYRAVPSERLVYGKRNGEFFERTLPSACSST